MVYSEHRLGVKKEKCTNAVMLNINTFGMLLIKLGEHN